MEILKRLLGGVYHIIKGDSLFIMKRRGLTVGERFWLGNARLDTGFLRLIMIGDDVTLGGDVMILAHDASTKIPLNYSRVGKVVIGSRVFVGNRSTIMPGVTIGDDVIIGAGSLVTGDIPSGSVAMGNPAKVRCTIEEFLARKREEMQTYPVFDTPQFDQRMLDAMKERFAYVP